jgi:hypothetical protein
MNIQTALFGEAVRRNRSGYENAEVPPFVVVSANPPLAPLL